MAVPHFDTEYGDSLIENVAIEFGPDLASQVTGDRRLTRTLQESLLAATESALDERKTYEQSLKRERESLREVRAGVSDCEQRAHELGDAAASRGGARVGLEGRFADLEEDCEDLAAARQRVIHRRRASRISWIGGESLTTFLYADIESTCPNYIPIPLLIKEVH